MPVIRLGTLWVAILRLLKQVILRVLQAVMGVAAVVCAFVPLRTFDKMLIFFCSILVIVACLIASNELEDDKTEAFSIWPDDRKK